MPCANCRRYGLHLTFRFAQFERSEWYLFASDRRHECEKMQIARINNGMALKEEKSIATKWTIYGLDAKNPKKKEEKNRKKEIRW